MTAFIDLLAENPLLLLFTVIGLGYLIGNIKIYGFKLGISAVLFVGMAFGALDARLSLPEYIYVIGLVLFVYALGLQAGPGFFASFQKRGVKFSIVAIIILGSGAAIAVLMGVILGMSAPNIAGLFCGALTNTPALAAAVETIKNLSPGMPADMAAQYARAPVVTYGLAYPFGVFGVILWFFIFTKIFKVDLAKEAAQYSLAAGQEAIRSKTYRITNPAIAGKTVEQTMKFFEEPGFILSRMKRGDEITIVKSDMILKLEDLVVAVGSASSHERALVLLGEEAPDAIAERRDLTSYRLLFVSNKSVVGKTIAELNFTSQFDATITRLRRGDVEFVPNPNTILELGDRILVVSPRKSDEALTKFFGDSVQALSETDFLSLSLGIVIGVFVGMISFPLPHGASFKLGFAGGPLVAGIIFGRLQRTGPIQWGLPYNANLVLRQIGLVFFLAGIGTKAGFGFGETFQQGAWGLFAAGAIVTSFVSIIAIIAGYKYLKLPMGGVMGMVSGIHTQPACLAYANQQSEGELPNLWYATVQPASMIAKIMLAQIIVSSLLLR